MAPSGLTATAVTVRAKPLSVRTAAPLSRSQILAVWSSLAETMRRPSGVMAMPVTDRCVRRASEASGRRVLSASAGQDAASRVRPCTPARVDGP